MPKTPKYHTITSIRWIVLEENSAKKSIAKIPNEIRKNYDDWVNVVLTRGIAGLRNIRGYDDKVLVGQSSFPENKRLRSSRLSRQWRVYYRADRGIVTVTVCCRRQST
jgi:hypothetical protein